MALAVCLLLDPPGDRAVRRLWQRIEDQGVPSMASHTHRHHLPHLSYAVLRRGEPEQVCQVLAGLPPGDPVRLRFDALGTFRRGRVWLLPALTSEVLRRQEQVATALAEFDLHRAYLPGSWVPHCTLAPRVRLDQVPAVAAVVFEVLPLATRASRAALVDSGTGQVWPLAHVL
ncbi:2'-5' RNA ligase family protein [Oryzihumus leptocrescens]|uniref:2'-5' RNA ligase superfamily protein n=1 Tax=Oryzihumus leptocrescens TaxID=297536 RepID=A0A542ZJ38_9MICO|nr:2'-5' RNA ligase family protein [Oryzihumus leptocrescens]TQL60367.1 2'-5' RNA ligase superfamily protein [Oryzihumus leptocrescens]